MVISIFELGKILIRHKINYKNLIIMKYGRMRKINFLIVCFGFATLHSQTPNVTIQTVSNYKGWKWDTTIVMQNDLITMATVPAIGGRVMQYDLGSLPSIMVNSSLLGKKYTPANNRYMV